MMVYEELLEDERYEEAAILFDEVAEVIKSPVVKATVIKALKAAAILSVISIAKFTYKYLKDGGFSDLKKAVVKATRKA